MRTHRKLFHGSLRPVVLVFALACMAPAFAAAHPAVAPNGAWAHQHTRCDYLLNEAGGAFNILYTETRDAQLDWHGEVRLRFDSTSNHSTSRIHVISDNHGPTNWVGLAEVCDHCGHLHVRLNPYYMQSDDWWQSTACDEIGHTVGEDHHDNGDCMGAQTATVGSHTISDIDHS